MISSHRTTPKSDKLLPTHIHVFSDINDGFKVNARFIFVFGKKDVDITIETCPRTRSFLDNRMNGVKFSKSFNIPRTYSEHPLPVAAGDDYTGSISYSFSFEKYAFVSGAYAPKPTALLPLKGMGIGYYLELIATGILIKNFPKPEYLNLMTGDNVLPPRQSQLAKIGLSINTPYPAGIWVQKLAIGVLGSTKSYKEKLEGRLI